jgi:GMP synthase (glutamine-hydrolysing)
MSVTFVVMEHLSRLTDERVRHFERIRLLLAELARQPVASVHYLDLEALGPGPVVLSGAGGPWDIHDPADFKRLGQVVLAAEAPVLGICGGMQLLAEFVGGRLETMVPATREELGYQAVEVLDARDLLAGLGPHPIVYHDHRDEIVDLPYCFRVLARTRSCEVQAVAAPERRWWGTQFHPECFDEAHPAGRRVLQNFFELAAD